MDRLINSLLLNNLGHTATSSQSELLRKMSAFLHDFSDGTVFIMKGYAGTGKTTVISSIVQTLNTLCKKSILLSPTGRAAKVMSLYSDKKAFTIHRQIYYTKAMPDGTFQLRKKVNKNVDTLFIVDEASMIHADNGYGEFFTGHDLLSDLIEFVYSGKNCKLLLVGDTAQLPPVGLEVSPALDEEYIFHNYGFEIISYEMKEVVRQELDSTILFNATNLRNRITTQQTILPIFEKPAILNSYKLKNDFHNLTDRNEIWELLSNSFTGSDIEDSVIICRSNKRANLYNNEIRRRFLQRDDEISSGDLLMAVKNNYFWIKPESDAGFIANGDILKLKRVYRITERYGFKFADVLVSLIDYPDMDSFECKLLLDTVFSEAASLEFEHGRRLWDAVREDYLHIGSVVKRREAMHKDEYLNALQVKFAYAMTCHKTQGGQWENVFVDTPFFKDDVIQIEDLRWFYTSLTRAISKLYLLNYPLCWVDEHGTD